jgi:hypothetical protein
MAALEHPSDETLRGLFEKDLAPEETGPLLEHLDACAFCSERLERLAPELMQYRQFRVVVEPRLPKPVRPWADLARELERRTGGTAPVSAPPPRMRRRPLLAAAFAAGLMVGALYMWPRQKESDVDAVLSRASRARAAAGSRLRVETPRGAFVRPAILFGTGVRAGGSDALRARFVAARYDWDDPLSPSSYARWRNSLENRRDYVETGPERTILRTTTQDSSLREARLTLAAPDLTPVSGRFEFDDREWVEISVLPESSSGAVAAPAAPQPAAPGLPQAPEPPLVERELQVRLAIDRLSPEAGLPVTVEVSADGRIVVTPYGLPPELGRQLEASLAGIPNVTLRDPARGGVTVAPGAPPVPSDSAGAIELSESAAATAHVLAELAGRFPSQAETELTPAGRAALWDMRGRHAQRLTTTLDALATRLAQDRGVSAADGPAAQRPQAAELVEAAGEVDALVTALYTNSRAASQIPELNRTLGAQVGRLRQLAREYARGVEEARAALR